MNIYFHIPYCKSKCKYCAFYSEILPPPAEYVEYMLQEMKEILSKTVEPVSTVYIGGGTPSALSPQQLRQLVSTIVAECVPEEFSIEVNPADVTQELLEALQGVTRISIGAQSFDDEILQFLGRRHTKADICHAVELVKTAGFSNFGLDLIAAIPSMTQECWEKTLDAAVELSPRHISIYNLSIEEGTPFFRSGLMPISDDEAMEQLALAQSRLNVAGYGRYEISNYAQSGYECKHNLAVWHGEDYFGIGAGAHSRVGQSRIHNLDNWHNWLAAKQAGATIPQNVEYLTEEEDSRERTFTQWRLLNEGVTFISNAPEKQALLKTLLEQDIIHELKPNTYALTMRGTEIADSIISAFM